VHNADNTYGAPRITAELNDGVPDTERVNHKRVARVMRTPGIAGYRRKRRVKTTQPDPANQKVPDLLRRDFTASAPNVKYVGDITYLPLATGANLYLATVIDCCSRRAAEVLQDRSSWPDAPTCRREVFHWLARYNTKRRHSHCLHSSPATYESTHTPATLPEAA
jgi:transposase InsO family protein